MYKNSIWKQFPRNDTKGALLRDVVRTIYDDVENNLPTTIFNPTNCLLKNKGNLSI